ncbi:MAG: methyltransferase [Polyangiaceae bacterium]
MKLAVRAQNPLEWVALQMNLAPVPVVQTSLYALASRALCEAVELGVFEAVGRGSPTHGELAAATGLDPRALDALVHLLVTLGYLADVAGRLRVTPLSRKWLLEDSETSVCAALRLFRAQWAVYDHSPSYLRTGKGFAGQTVMHHDTWSVYQKAMFQLARMGVAEVAKKTPLPPAPRRMLDVGGSHGLYSVHFCRRVPAMRAEVLDLPEAIESAAALLASVNAERRVQHRAGDVLETDLGEAVYDVVLVSSVVHVFDDGDNRQIVANLARALRPGGRLYLQDFVRPDAGTRADAVSSAQNLFFSTMSAGGVYSIAEQQGWQREAGLEPLAVTRFLSTPLVQVSARKPP